jgi:MFS superfamily sulfate permease-like transporter
MRSREPELLLWWLLLPIFFLGMLPMLVFGFLGLIGLGMLGVLLVCVGLGNGLHANSDFNREVIVRGYARRTERTIHASNLHSAIRFSTAMILTGAGLIVVGFLGFFCFG